MTRSQCAFVVIGHLVIWLNYSKKESRLKCRWGKDLIKRLSAFRACGPPPDVKMLHIFTPLNSDVMCLETHFQGDTN